MKVTIEKTDDDEDISFEIATFQASDFSYVVTHLATVTGKSEELLICEWLSWLVDDDIDFLAVFVIAWWGAPDQQLQLDRLITSVRSAKGFDTFRDKTFETGLDLRRALYRLVKEK